METVSCKHAGYSIHCGSFAHRICLNLVLLNLFHLKDYFNFLLWLYKERTKTIKDLFLCSVLNKITIINREIYDRYHASYKGKEDIHTRLMKNYKDIPSWWFYILLAATFVVSLVLCVFLNDQVQMPWWGLLFAAAMAFVFTLPISIITATTNQVINLYIENN